MKALLKKNPERGLWLDDVPTPHIDINAGAILDGSEGLNSVGKRIFDMIVETSGGMKTKAEALGFKDFVVFKRDRAAEHMLRNCLTI